jgi:RNA polymerase sigma-70 factor, ECF subfamily
MAANPSDEQDRTDMARLVAGQDAALNDLMSRHGEKVLRYLLRVLGNETEAGDLAQETFVRVYLHRARFNAAEKFATWLYTIATNLARDRRRWHSRHPQVSLENDSDDPAGGLKHSLAAPGPTPAERLESGERAAAVRQAVAGLPEDLRLPLVLAEYEERSHAEIAAILSCSPKAVEMRIYRARQQLRAVLAPLLPSLT